VLQRSAVRCGSSRYDAVRCSALYRSAVRRCALHCIAVHCIALQCIAVRCSALQCVAVSCNALQRFVPLKKIRVPTIGRLPELTCHIYFLSSFLCFFCKRDMCEQGYSEKNAP